MTLPSYTVDQFTLSSALPKGFIEIPTLSTKPKLMLINVSSIAHIKVRDSKTHHATAAFSVHRRKIHHDFAYLRPGEGDDSKGPITPPPMYLGLATCS